jgi:hypothetical protein
VSPEDVADHLERPPGEEPPVGRGIPPRRAAAIVGGLMAAAAVYVGASGAPFTSEPATAPITKQAPPAEEHVTPGPLEAFEHLEDKLVRAYRTADASHLKDVLTADSPLVGTARREIRDLVRERVRAHLNFRTRSLVVVRHTETEAIIRQEVVERVRLFTPGGLPLPPKHRAMVNTIDWTLRVEKGEWRIHDSNVLNARPRGGTRGNE